MNLPSVDDLFSTEESRQEAKLTKIYDIPISEIDDCPDNPYKVRDDEDMLALIDSVRENGVLVPALVRKKDDGRYEIVSGHRRKRACEKLELPTLRCEIAELTRDEAIIKMVDSNCQRSYILPSEKAFAYKLKLEAIKRQGKRTDLTSTPVGEKLEGKDALSVTQISNESGESQTQIQRYIRLTNLVPELLQFVDEGKIAMRPAVELSYLDEDTQRDVVDRIDDTEVFPSHDQAIRIRKAFEEGQVNYDRVRTIMAEEKPNQKPKFKFSFERLQPLIPSEYTPVQAEEYVIKALEHYNNFLQKQRNQHEHVR